MLFAVAEHVVEGSTELTTRADASGGKRVFATVMVTIDLCACSAYFREPTDDATAQRVAELMGHSTRVRDKLVELARPELARLADARAEDLDVTLDHEVRAEGTRVLIDGDAMGWRGGPRRS